MKFTKPLAVLMITASLFGCITSSSSSVNVPLEAMRQNAGQIGRVTLTDWDKQTGLSFFISGAPSGVTLPLRIYTFIYKGSCQKRGPVAYAMNDLVNTKREPIRGWTFNRVAPFAMSELLSGEYAIVVQTAATDGSVDIFCGDIPQEGAAK